QVASLLDPELAGEAGAVGPQLHRAPARPSVVGLIARAAARSQRELPAGEHLNATVGGGLGGVEDFTTVLRRGHAALGLGELKVVDGGAVASDGEHAAAVRAQARGLSFLEVGDRRVVAQATNAIDLAFTRGAHEHARAARDHPGEVLLGAGEPGGPCGFARAGQIRSLAALAAAIVGEIDTI